MARSPLTLAASVTSALPRVGVVGVGALTEGAAGRYDSAVAQLDDGRRVVVRAPAEAGSVAELAAEAQALRALTPGVRGLLPFRAPELLGETGLGDSRAIVVDFLSGYRVDAAHVPPGAGAATSIGEALAALHALPVSIVRAEGLPVRTSQQVRDDISRLLTRVDSTRRAPDSLVLRWRRAVEIDAMWQFESAVILGGATAASFLFEDIDGVPTVTGVLGWHGLSVGDPAIDLQWLASAPAAADDVYDMYASQSRRAPDVLVRERSRLYAELEFAKWLVHGYESGEADVVDDAVGLLVSLAEGVEGDELVSDAALDVDDAIALLDRVPESAPASIDTSMQTDAYDPALLSLFIADDESDEDAEAASTPEAESALEPEPEYAPAPGPEPASMPAPEAEQEPTPTPAPESESAPDAIATFDPDHVSTAPIDISTLTRPSTDEDAQADAERSAEAALRRWTGSAQ